MAQTQQFDYGLARTHLKNNDLTSFQEYFLTESKNNDHSWILHNVCCPEVNTYDNVAFVYWLVNDCGIAVDSVPSRHPGPITSLFYASAGLPNCVQALLKLGADVHVVKTNTNDRTPIVESLDAWADKSEKAEKCMWHLLEHSATLPKKIPLSVPKLAWNIAKSMIRGRSCARYAAMIFLGFQRFGRSKVLLINGKDMACLIAQFIWESRINYTIWSNVTM